ncbi:MAG: hypothetical protein TH68_08825, partial [Candidatus Synechococcus spongiarum 142]
PAELLGPRAEKPRRGELFATRGDGEGYQAQVDTDFGRGPGEFPILHLHLHHEAGVSLSIP